MIYESPNCMECKYYNKLDIRKNSCKAFPKGIPEEILIGKHDHTKPFKGDNGILFEAIKEIQDPKADS